MEILFLNNSLTAWAAALGILVLIFVTLVISRRLALKRFKPPANDLARELILATSSYFLASVAIYAATDLLTLHDAVHLIFHRIFILIALLQGGTWSNRATAFWIEHYLKKRALSDSATATSIGLVSFSVKFGLFSVLILLGIHNFGFDITTLIAGLGVGGIAVALAVQNILGDLFASLSIVLDKPFAVGDSIAVGEFVGAIEHIGLKTTRIRSASGEQLIFSNGDLLRSRVRNFKRMSERRITFTLSLVYQTQVEKLAQVPSLIKKVISAVDNTRVDRCHFLKFGLSSLDIEVVYWVKSADFNVYADIAQEINLEILRRFREEGIELAYPSQTLFLRQPAVHPGGMPRAQAGDRIQVLESV